MVCCRIVLADDHVIVRQGLRRIIEGTAGLEVIGEAGDGLELLELLKSLDPDLIVLDISMPRLRGIEAIGEVKAIRPHLKVLILTMHREIDLLVAAISAGASGYVLKEDADAQLFAAIEKILHGGTYVPPKMADELAVHWARTVRGEQSPVAQGDPLTVREKEVLKLAAEGKTSKEIAGLLHISYRTVEHHRANVMAKLSLKRATDLVKYAISKGYL
jgi:two-component system, NarL family, response regulator NreC